MITQSATNTAINPGQEFIVSTTKQVLATNPNRRGALILALSGNSKRARFVFGTVVHSNSAPLEAGGSLTLDSSYLGPVTMISDDQSTQINIYVVEW